MIKRYFLIMLAAVISGCVTPQSPSAVAQQEHEISPVMPLPEYREPASSAASRPAEAIKSPVVSIPPAPAVPKVPIQTAHGTEILNKLLPAKIAERKAWSEDIYNAFVALQIPQTAEYFCAALSIIEQESSWQSDPVVPGLGKIVWKEIGLRAEKYHIPLITVQAALMVPSLNGRSYKARIDALRTEKEMNDLFEAMLNDAPDIVRKLNITNPIRTGGPMQVGVEFASAHTRAWPYPYPLNNSIRSEVFTRRGGVYFGIAHLLQYRAAYPSMLYRFADFNAGRHSSRNAAFQQAVSKISKVSITQDGDLLIYRQNLPVSEPSATQKALQGISSRLGLTSQEIATDLLKEKTALFEQTQTYQRVFGLADQLAKTPAPREILPQIRLQSSKISRKLTTAWFAERVNGRYQQCLARQ